MLLLVVARDGRRDSSVPASVATCTRCGQENPDGAKFCNACGAALGEPGRVGEERRIVSVLFVDLVGFTSRAESLDPEDVREFLTPYYEQVRPS